MGIVSHVSQPTQCADRHAWTNIELLLSFSETSQHTSAAWLSFLPALWNSTFWLGNWLQISAQYTPDNEMHYGGLVNVTVEEMKLSVMQILKLLRIIIISSSFPTLSSPPLFSVQLVELVPCVWVSTRSHIAFLIVERGKRERGTKSFSVAEQFTPGIVFNDFFKALNCVVNSSL